MPTEELFGSYHFLLEIQGVINDNKVIVGGFKSVSGMDSETEIIEFGGTMDQIVRKRPGRHKYTDITLKRGWMSSDEETSEEKCCDHHKQFKHEGVQRGHTRASKYALLCHV